MQAVRISFTARPAMTFCTVGMALTSCTAGLAVTCSSTWMARCYKVATQSGVTRPLPPSKIFLWCARVQPSRTFTYRVMGQAWQDEAHRRMTRLFSPSAQRRSQARGLTLQPSSIVETLAKSCWMVPASLAMSKTIWYLIRRKTTVMADRTWSSSSRMAPPCSWLAM